MKSDRPILILHVGTVVACLGFATSRSLALDVFVDISQSNGGGGSWISPLAYLADAFSLAVAPGDRIFVACGEYRPDQTYIGGISNDASASFTIPAGVEVHGGYKGGGGVDAGTRDLALYPTTLTGEIGDEAVDDNSYHVIKIDADDHDHATILDGFRVESGFAFGDTTSLYCDGDPFGLPGSGGAGFRCINASNVGIRDCEFRFNQARTGGAIQLLCSNPKIVNCTFERNSASSPEDAADLDLRDEEQVPCGAAPILPGEAHLDDAGNGGAIHMSNGSNPRIDNCVFRCNLAGHVGGAISTQKNASPDLTNCVFFENFVWLAGGAYRAGFDTGSVLVNCTFAGNVAANHGGAFSMSRDDAGAAPRDTELRNCILWGNTKSHCSPEEPCPGGQIEIFGEGDGQVLVLDHCDVQGGKDEIIDVTPAVVQWDNDTDFDLDPLFANLAQGQLQLGYWSPCVNGGDPTYFPNDEADVDGDPANNGDPVPWDVARQDRFANQGCLDVGAYENQVGTCLGDITDSTGGLPDGTVNSYDMGIVLGAWGNKPGGVADIADAGSSSPCGDGIVDGADLAAVFGAWGDCPGSSAARSTGGGTSGPTPTEVAVSMGFASLDEFVAWLGEMDPESMAGWLMMIFGS